MTKRDDDGEKPDDKVGYKQPPKKHQFKPGQSGCPDGGHAQRKAKKLAREQKLAEKDKQQEESLRVTIARVAAEMQTVTTKAGSVQMPTMEVLVRQTLARALKPDAGDQQVARGFKLCKEAGLFDAPSTEPGQGLLVVYAPMKQQEWIDATEGELLPRNPLHGIPGCDGLLDQEPMRRGTPLEDK